MSYEQGRGSATAGVLASPFAKRRGQCMRWSNINMTVIKKSSHNSSSSSPEDTNNNHPHDNGTTTTTILQNVSGTAPSGQVTAIMGESGSGKTSLLNILSGRVVSVRNQLCISYDDISMNHQPFNPATNLTVRQRIAFCAQDDSLPVTATPREAILFSARLRLPKTVADQDLVPLADRLLEELHLLKCADTVIGGALMFKGLSGGERKRTSVGVELVTRPSIVFCDEPTSGLDSFNALELCQVLKKVANAGCAVLMTIHQPSSAIFTTLMDRLLLLKKGRVMYSGPANEAVIDYFGHRGYPCPPHHNPADWIITVAQTQSTEQLENQGFFAPEEEKEEQENDQKHDEINAEKDQTDALGHSEPLLVTDKDRVGMLLQVKLLFVRELRNLVRNKKALMARTGMTLMVSLLAGVIFFQVAETDFDEFINVQTTFGGLLVSLLANVFSTALPSLVVFPEERPVFIREYSTNHYSVTAYFMSRFTMELLVTAAQVTVSSALTYTMIGFSAPFGPFWASLYTLAMASTALGVLMGCSVRDPGVAMELMPLVLIPQILFAGFFIPPDLIPVWLRWIVYVFPLTYATRIVLVNEFDGRCDGNDPNYCQLVLDNVEADPDDVWWYWIVLLCQCTFLRLLALFILRKKSSSFN